VSPATRAGIVRAIAAIVTVLGLFCLVYHLLFYALWRFLFGEEVWPWPGWSLVLLVALPAAAAFAGALFMAIARLTARNSWIGGALVILSLFGLVAYAGRVWKLIVQLGFHP
jgi:hypothetical protein